MTDKKIPGVTVFLDGCTEKGSLLTPGAINFTFTVGGTAQTQEIYDKLKAKMDEGMVLSTVDNLQGVMLKSLREDNTALEQRNRELEMQLLNARKELLELKGRAVPFKFQKQ